MRPADRLQLNSDSALRDKRIPPRAAPAFEDEGMQARVWGRRWGVYNDVGPLKMVLVHRPGEEIRTVKTHREPMR